MSFLAKLEEDLKYARWAFANGRFEEGLAVSQAYAGPTSRNREFLHAHAMLLFGLSRFTEADTFYGRVIELDPRNAEAFARQIDCQIFTGRKAEAAELTARARAQFPHNGHLLGAALGQILIDQGPSAAIAALAAEKRSAEPCQSIDVGVETLRQKMLSLYDLSEIDDPENHLGLDRTAPASGSYKLRDIYEQFESLGANCDFGFIQRTRGAEPLSLMRWTSITPANLIRLLQDDLVGYDEPSRYSLRGAYEKEFMLYEDYYETIGHTGVNSADIGAEEFLERLTRRQTFLTRKFLAELKAGKKIFTYKAKTPMSDSEIEEIDRELIRLGAQRTMFTMPTDDPAKAGTISFPTAGRATAYVSNRPFTESMHEWDRIIVSAYDHFTRADAKAA